MSTKPTRIAPWQHSANATHTSLAARVSLACLMAFALFVASTAFFVYHTLASNVKAQSLDISGLGAATQSGETASPPPSDKFEGRALNILLLGSDSRQGASNQAYGGGAVGGMRADTTMLLHISADRKRVEVVSIPRDLMVTIPSCTRSDGSVSSETYGMFNSAIAIGANWGYDTAGGVACVKSTVEQMTGLSVDGFALIDFGGFVQMVDALGGVWFDPGNEPLYDEAAHLDLPAGCQQLNGTQALAYARARKNLGDGSDISRITRQQKLVSAMFRELMAKNFVTDLPALMSFLNQALASMQVSSNLSDLSTDVGLMLSLTDIERSHIQFITMPVVQDPDDPNRVVANEPSATNTWEALKADQALPNGSTVTTGEGEEATVAQSGSVTTPSDPAGSTITDPTHESAASPNGPGVEPSPAPTSQCPPANQ